MLAFNLGIQHHLEAFIRQKPQQGNADPETNPMDLGRKGSDAEHPSESQEMGCQQWVEIAHLPEPLMKEGFGKVQQPGKSQDITGCHDTI